MLKDEFNFVLSDEILDASGIGKGVTFHAKLENDEYIVSWNDEVIGSGEVEYSIEDTNDNVKDGSWILV